jgi:hypothetical protein
MTPKEGHRRTDFPAPETCPYQQRLDELQSKLDALIEMVQQTAAAVQEIKKIACKETFDD